MTSFQTNNQQYGSHFSKSSASRQKIGTSTLQFLKKTDQGGFLHQQQNIAQKERHGLFTQPMTLATGDFYQDKKPQQQAKNMSVNKKMQQKVGPQLFQKMSSTNIGDMYKDKFRQKQLYEKQKCDLSVHPRAFIAGGKQKLIHNSEFQHKKQFDDKQYDTKNEEGKVKTGLKNVYTNKMKKGFGNTTVGHLFGAYKYQGTPDENARQIQKNEKLIHKAKILKPFTSASRPGQTFTPNYTVYHLEGQNYKPKDQQNLYRSKTNQKWKCNNANKKGFYGTFSQFPKYIEEGEKPKQRTGHQSVWKPNFNGTSKNFKETLSRPCPPASQLLLNEMRRVKK